MSIFFRWCNSPPFLHMTIREIDGGVCFLQASPSLFATAADRGGLFRPLLRGRGPLLSAPEGPPLVMLLPLPPPAETDWFCRHPPSDPEMDPLDRETGKPACASGLHAPYPIPQGRKNDLFAFEEGTRGTMPVPQAHQCTSPLTCVMMVVALWQVIIMGVLPICST